MTPRTAAYMFPAERVLDDNALAEISGTGHSRIPVFKKTHDEIVGILYVKDLVKGMWRGRTASEAARKNVIFVDVEKKLDDLLNDFKKTKQHLFVAINKYGVVDGIVTIEDVLEEIIGAEIVDEYDKFADLQEVAREKLKSRGVKTI